MRILSIAITVAAVLAACYLISVPCKPGDKGVKIAGVMLISGCQ